ncbi:hypothetical protein BX616_002620 [Lobosporangium transversale]|nr:hypothetical protein BX616_002620 [Lobosporangium transversale]
MPPSLPPESSQLETSMHNTQDVDASSLHNSNDKKNNIVSAIEGPQSVPQKEELETIQCDIEQQADGADVIKKGSQAAISRNAAVLLFIG